MDHANFSKCRVCLKEGSMINIFHVRHSVKISTIIMSIAKVQIHPEDGLPSTICRKCLKKLDSCINFIKLCESSDMQLKNSAQNPKEDPSSYLDIDLENDAYSTEDFLKFSARSGSMEISVAETINSSHLSEDDNLKSINVEDYSDDSKNIDISKKKEKQQCSTCGKVMSSRFRLKTHLRTHTGERPYSCPHCSKNFALAQNLKVHLRIHTGEKPLTCTDCGASFAHSAGLAAHRRKHTGQTPYHCMLCPRSFRTIGHLQYHTRRHTGEKNFECDTCSRAFITRSDLKQHLLSHSGYKPHVCCICGLRLTRASHLKRHIQFIHNGEKPFTCTVCAVKFTHKGDYEKHKKIHESSDESGKT